MRPTILCAQADAHLSEIHRQALAEAGYRVLVVHDGEGALSAAAEEDVHVALLDAQLPRRDGFDVMQRLREREGPSGALPGLILHAGRVGPETSRRIEAMGDVVLLSKPVALDDLVGHIAKLSKVPAEAGAGDARRRRTPHKGSLREVHFGSILHGLHDARASGVLLVESGKKKKAVQLRDGYPVAVKSNLVTECLGNMLARRGRLTQDQLDESLRRVKRGEGLQGEILVAMEVLDEETVSAALREQAEAKLLEIFEWRRGTYAFQMGKKLQRAATLALSESPATLILEGARRHVPIARVDDYLARHGRACVAASDAPFHRFQSIGVSEDELAQLSDLGPDRPVGSYCDAPERVRRILYGLLVTEVLELTSPESVASTAPGHGVAPGRVEPATEDDAEIRRELTALAQDLREKTYYEVLGLPTIAGDDAVRRAYAEQIERVHPDRYRQSSGAVRQVADEIYMLFTRAYEALRDPEARAAYASEMKRDIEAQRDQVRSKKILSAEMAFQRGEAALRQRDYQGALVFFGSALEQLPDEGLYRAYYGWCLHLCHPDNEVILQEAAEHVQSGIKLARDHEMPYLFLGRIYKVLGRTAAAERMFTRAVQLRSDCVEALRELRLLNMRREKRRGLIGRILKKD
jgi:CheY-like chemotaxis protein